MPSSHMTYYKAKGWLRQEAETLRDSQMLLNWLEQTHLTMHPDIHFKNKEGEFVWKEDVRKLMRQAYIDEGLDLRGAHLDAFIQNIMGWYLSEVKAYKPSMKKVLTKVKKNLKTLVKNA